MRISIVTGTDGKTSVVEFGRQLSKAVGVPAASVGTLGLHRTDDDLEPIPVFGPMALPLLAEELEATGTKSLFVEGFSAPLMSDIFDKVPLFSGAFTGLGTDHTHIHGSVENYYRAKRRLFDVFLPSGSTAVLNRDTVYFRDLHQVCSARGIETLSYGGSHDADLRLIDFNSGGRSKLGLFGNEVEVHLPFDAGFFAHNALCAMGLVAVQGVDVNVLVRHVEALELPPGRMEVVADHDGRRVIVDYAHTPEALKAALGATITSGRRLVVFGCGGRSDPAKRFLMGKCALELADVVIVTDDNPRTEPPEQIRAAILEGCPGAHEVPDRKDAIRFALELMRPGDALLIAGRGNEEYQQLADGSRPLSDRGVVKEVLGVGEHST